jgi:hypothetical protein
MVSRFAPHAPSATVVLRFFFKTFVGVCRTARTAPAALMSK